jgi:hypothetical protein
MQALYNKTNKTKRGGGGAVHTEQDELLMLVTVKQNIFFKV